MIELKDKELNKVLKAYKAYKQAKAEYDSLKVLYCEDLAVGKYISKLGTLNKHEAYSRIFDREKFKSEHPEIDISSYEKITPYTTVKIKLNV